MESPLDKINARRDVTQLLERIHSGDAGAWEPLLAEVHMVLHAMAHRRMQDERTGHLLQTTALVNEAYMRLAQSDAAGCEHRAEFFAAAGAAMRRILVDEARRRRAAKRGDGAAALRISQVAELEASASTADDLDLEALDSALARFEEQETGRTKTKVVELRYFVGLTLEQTADVLGVSLATVKRDWDFARAWLRREMARMAHENG